jgi:lysine-specific demethylase 8
MTAQLNAPRSPMRTLERVHRPSREAFIETYLKQDKPVIITGLLDDWPALGKWTDDYLNERVGDRLMPFWVSRDQVFGVNPFQDLETEDLAFRDFLRICQTGQTGGKHYYLRKGSMDALMADLLEDIRYPEYLDKRWLLSTNMWMGPAGNDTPLHYDLSHNLLAQLRGRKRCLLFAPEDIQAMYPNPWFSNSPHFSRILDIKNPDPVQFPRFQEATPYECVVEEGEVLFLPICWWHQVLSVDMAISVNFWWAPPLDYMHPLVIRTAGTPIHKWWMKMKGSTGG